MSQFTSLEMCAGAGGQALGLEMAGFGHEILVGIVPPACGTLHLNRPEWNVREEDLRQFNEPPYYGVDLVAGGVPCPPFSKAGKQLGANAWKAQANTIALTLVGGSKKHGGPDLGPTRAKKAWASIGVCGMGIASNPPAEFYEGMPKLTAQMAARIQGFSDNWQFHGKKTAAYRQIGNAFPPPVACAVATQIFKALSAKRLVQVV